MRWVPLVRAIGVFAGVLLIGIGADQTVSGLADPPTSNLESFVVFAASLLIAGGLLAAPWSRIRPVILWYVLFSGLVLMVPPMAVFIYALNSWSAMHGAGAEGYALVVLLTVAWVTQLPAIWSLRPRRNRSALSARATAN
jgi:hypothetical protein